MKQKRTIVIFLAALLTITYGVPFSTYTEAKTVNQPVQDFANIVLFAQFSGDNAEEDAAYFADHKDDILKLYDGDYAWSLTNYMSQISYDQFHVHNIYPQITGSSLESYTLSMTADSMKDRDASAGGDAIVQELIQNVPGVADQVVDYNNDGAIDNLTVIVRGRVSDSSYPALHPHKSSYGGTDYYCDKRIGNYNIINTYRMLESGMPEKSGVIAHEFMHSIGYLDLYNNTDYPVYTWDIMAATSQYLTWPLAYTRMAVSHWIDIETVTSSRTLTLDTQDATGGNQAYILKSPLNENEVFVVEFRKQGASSVSGTTYELDEKIGGSGVIVYRVDTTAAYLSNYYDSNAIYVFRPQAGQSGYHSTESICVQNAFLSQESGRTSIGSSDLDKGPEDGALTFTDGTNSGIVIQNVSSSSGTQMTLEVSIPAASDFDGWTNMEFPDNTSGTALKNVTIADYNGTLYLLAYMDSQLATYRYDGTKWVAGATIACRYTPLDMKLFNHNGNLYAGYLDGNSSQFHLLRWNAASGSWNEVASVANAGSEFDVVSQGTDLYLTYISDNQNAYLAKFTGSGFQTLGTYSNGSLCGQPRVACMNGIIYTGLRYASGNVIEVYRYQNGFTKVSEGTLSGGTYDMTVLDNCLTVCIGGSDLRIHTYNGTTWTQSAASGISCFEPVVTTQQGKIYVLISPSDGKGNIRVYRYDSASGHFTQEGMDVDSYSQHMTLVDSADQLYIAYVKNSDGKITVRRKNTSVQLVSLQVTPPKKLQYRQGETVSTNGLRVIANYSDQTSKEVPTGAYQLTGFDTTVVGKRQAKISYEGLSVGFQYTVVADAASGSTEDGGGNSTGSSSSSASGGGTSTGNGGSTGQNPSTGSGQTGTETIPTVKNQWVEDNGVWYYMDADGQPATGWLQNGGNWYHLDHNGVMETGWVQVDSVWYYLDGSGVMQTDWKEINGHWYYFYGNGAMAQSVWIGGDYVDASGAWIPNAVPEGWKRFFGRWWYQNADGTYPANGWKCIGGSWYYFDAAGWMQTGWIKPGNTWYYLYDSGAMATGWLSDAGTWYYLNADGAMATGWIQVDGTWYYLESSGAMKTGWLLDGSTWYYLYDSGAMATGWIFDGTAWYYLYGNGAMAYDTVIDAYVLDESGAWVDLANVKSAVK